MFTFARREFLAATSLAVGKTLWDTRRSAVRFPDRIVTSSFTANALIPDPIDPSSLQQLAAAGIEAARSAGASYADIRVAERHELSLGLSAVKPFAPITEMETTVAYGLRVIANGAWAFVYGTAPSVDTIATAARNAVATAQGYAGNMKRRVELAPAPVVTGTWATPFKLDPFSVPLRDQGALLGAYRAAANRVYHGNAGQFTEFRWTRDHRVFASSEGSAVTQDLRWSEPRVRGAGDVGLGEFGSSTVELLIPGITHAAGGYETVAIPGMQERIKATTEEAVRLATLPRRVLDVGRYPVVFDGVSLGAVLGQTIGRALELDRVLGYEADAGGTSYLSPPLEMLGTPITSPSLTVTAHRNLPTLTAAQWDDEGVTPKPYPVITDGRLMDFHTSRQTALALRSWYEGQGRPVASHGCMIAPEASHPALIRPPHLTVDAPKDGASVDELCKGIRRGLLVRGASTYSIDQQLVSASLVTLGSKLFEIENGKIVRRLDANALQFGTTTFWKSIGALGNASTLEDCTFKMQKGQPWRTASQTVTAPAGLIKDVNIVSAKLRI